MDSISKVRGEEERGRGTHHLIQSSCAGAARTPSHLSPSPFPPPPRPPPSLLQAPHRAFLIRCSYIEIYKEAITDLLSKKALDVHESKTRVSRGARNKGRWEEGDMGVGTSGV
jgi:hypothetical protein